VLAGGIIYALGLSGRWPLVEICGYMVVFVGVKAVSNILPAPISEQ